MRFVPFLVSVITLVVITVGGTGATSLPGRAVAAATQDAAHAAGVVIADPDGGPPKTVCVRFSEDAITGKQLLDRAEQLRGDIDPVYARFGSRGHAVCALCGEGCDAGDCFCQSRYWNYNVARDGGWARAGVGVDQRVVEHGDVDGWAFGGDGAAPPYISFETICGQQDGPTPGPEPSPTAPRSDAPRSDASPTATPSPDPTTPASASTAPSPSPSARTPDDDPSPTERSGGAPAVTASPTDTPAVPTPSPSPSAGPAAAGSGAGRAGGDSAAATNAPWDALGFGVLLGGVVGLILWRRRH